jgi:hypothetical protein
MKNQLFTHERDTRKEEPIHKSVFELLSSRDEWCALYAPVGEPELKRVPKTPFGGNPKFEEILAYKGEILVAVNRPLGSDRTAEVYDHKNGCTYYIDNERKKITRVDGVREPLDFSGIGGNRFTFKGTVDDIIREFKEHHYVE